MTLRISGKSISVGDALRSRVSERTDEVLRKYFDGNYSGHITLSKDGFGFRTDCSLHLDSGITLEADSNATDAYASADQALVMIEKRLRRYKSRLKDRSARKTYAANAALAEIGGPMLDAPSYVIEAPAEGDDSLARDSGDRAHALGRVLEDPPAERLPARRVGVDELAVLAAERDHDVQQPQRQRGVGAGDQRDVLVGALGGARDLGVVRKIDPGVGLRVRMAPGSDMMPGRIEERAEPHLTFVAHAIGVLLLAPPMAHTLCNIRLS